MSIAGLMFALALVFAAGFGAASLLAGRGLRLSALEKIALSWLLGAGGVSLATWLFGMALGGVALRLAVTALALALIFLGARVRASAPEPRAKLDRWELAALVVLAAQAVFIVVCAPKIALGWDGLTIWESKARLAWQSGGTLPAAYFSDEWNLWSHPYYPLQLPYLEAWLYGWMGGVSQPWVRVIGPLYYAAAVALIVSGVARLGAGRRIGLWAGAAFFFVPYFFGGRWGVLTGYADFPLGVLLLGAVVWSLAWLESGSAGALRLFAALAALLPWMKREGKLAWLAALCVPLLVLLARRRWRDALLVVIPGAFVIAGYGAFLAANDVVADATYFPVTLENFTKHSARLWPVAQLFGHEFLALDDWSLLWPGALAALIALFFFREKMRAAALGAVIVLPLAAYAFTYVFSTWDDPLWHVVLSCERLYLHVAPAAFLALALAWPGRNQTDAVSVAKSNSSVVAPNLG